MKLMPPDLAIIKLDNFTRAGSPPIHDDSPEDIVDHMEEVAGRGGVEQVSFRDALYLTKYPVFFRFRHENNRGVLKVSCVWLGCQGVPGGRMETEHLGHSMTEIAIVTGPDAGVLPGNTYNYHGDGTDSLASTGSPAEQARRNWRTIIRATKIF